METHSLPTRVETYKHGKKTTEENQNSTGIDIKMDSKNTGYEKEGAVPWGTHSFLVGDSEDHSYTWQACFLYLVKKRAVKDENKFSCQVCASPLQKISPSSYTLHYLQHSFLRDVNHESFSHDFSSLNLHCTLHACTYVKTGLHLLKKKN